MKIKNTILKVIAYTLIAVIASGYLLVRCNTVQKEALRRAEQGAVKR